jgi:predicted DNA-binding ribbon-helix-helix protein
MKSATVKHSVILAGHKTSISLEEPFWKGLNDIARNRKQSLATVITHMMLTVHSAICRRPCACSC